MTEKHKQYAPITPGGTCCGWLMSDTEDAAWSKLLLDAAHMPYNGVAGFKERGYTVEEFVDPLADISDRKDKLDEWGVKADE